MSATASRDRHNVLVGASEATANSSSHPHESLPMSSNRVEVVSPVDRPEIDAHPDNQYVFVEYGHSRADSPSVFSDWSIEGLDNELAARDAEGRVDVANMASKVSYEELIAALNSKDTCTRASGAYSPSSAICIPNSSSNISDAQRLPPRSSQNSKLENRVPEEDDQSPSILIVPVSSLEAKARRLTRRCQIRLASKFDPAGQMPEEQFEVRTVYGCVPHVQRYVNRWMDREIMLVVDGSCTFTGAMEGQTKPSECEPSAGASFIFRPCGASDASVRDATTFPFQIIEQARNTNASASGGWQKHLPMPEPIGKIGLRLETQGPRGDVQKHTSNRAKLRAVIAALDFRPWHAEGWERVVVITDLEYIVQGATQWISRWAKRRWRAAPSWTQEGKMRLGRKIANRDLWEELQSRVDSLQECGTEVSFWLVPTSSKSPLLREAKAAAREAARLGPDTVVVEEYTKLIGVNM